LSSAAPPGRPTAHGRVPAGRVAARRAGGTRWHRPLWVLERRSFSKAQAATAAPRPSWGRVATCVGQRLAVHPGRAADRYDTAAQRQRQAGARRALGMTSRGSAGGGAWLAAMAALRQRRRRRVHARERECAARPPLRRLGPGCRLRKHSRSLSLCMLLLPSPRAPSPASARAPAGL